MYASFPMQTETVSSALAVESALPHATVSHTLLDAIDNLSNHAQHFGDMEVDTISFHPGSPFTPAPAASDRESSWVESGMTDAVDNGNTQSLALEVERPVPAYGGIDGWGMVRTQFGNRPRGVDEQSDTSVRVNINSLVGDQHSRNGSPSLIEGNCAEHQEYGMDRDIAIALGRVSVSSHGHISQHRSITPHGYDTPRASCEPNISAHALLRFSTPESVDLEEIAPDLSAVRLQPLLPPPRLDMPVIAEHLDNHNVSYGTNPFSLAPVSIGSNVAGSQRDSVGSRNVCEPERGGRGMPRRDRQRVYWNDSRNSEISQGEDLSPRRLIMNPAGRSSVNEAAVEVPFSPESTSMIVQSLSTIGRALQDGVANSPAQGQSVGSTGQDTTFSPSRSLSPIQRRGPGRPRGALTKNYHVKPGPKTSHGGGGRQSRAPSRGARGAARGNARGAARGNARGAAHSNARGNVNTAAVPALRMPLPDLPSRDEQQLSEYELRRRETIRQNQESMAAIGLNVPLLPERPPPSRPQIVRIEDVFKLGCYGGPCPGWSYSITHGGYFKMWIRSQFTNLHQRLAHLDIYVRNGLFRRRELAIPLDPINWSTDVTGLVPATSGIEVFPQLVPSNERCFRVPDAHQIERFIFIDGRLSRIEPLERGGMKYCHGAGERLHGQGLYVSFFDEGDYGILLEAVPDLRHHYTLCRATCESPSGYYYHDAEDTSFSRPYALVDLASRASSRPRRAIGSVQYGEQEEDR